MDYLEKILNARVYDVAIETPLEFAPILSTRMGNRVLLKREDMQPVFSFKLRGAYNKIVHLTPAQRKRGVICASAGNHAQGVALAAQKLGIRAVIVMPTTTPQIKIDAVRKRGGEVVLAGESYDAAHAHALELEKQKKLTFVHPFDDPEVIAGQGTIGMEILRQHPEPIEAVFCCVGGGGLISGCAVAAKHKLPGIAVIGVEPEAGNDTQQSLAAGNIVQIAVPQTIADGAQTQASGQLTFPVIQALVERIVTVSDAQLIRTMQFFAERMKQVVEPTGCLGAAALLEGVVDLRGARVGVILSGGNVDLPRYAQMLATA